MAKSYPIKDILVDEVIEGTNKLRKSSKKKAFRKKVDLQFFASIHGIGVATQKHLIAAGFGTKESLMLATKAQLCKISGIGKKRAELLLQEVSTHSTQISRHEPNAAKGEEDPSKKVAQDSGERANVPKKLSDYVPMPPPICEEERPGQEPASEEYSTESYSDLVDEYSSTISKAFPPNHRPLKELEVLCKSPERYIILTGGTGRGKTLAVLLFIINFFSKYGGHAISFVHSRVLGKVQKDKFDKLVGDLGEKSSRCLLYYKRRKIDGKNREIRKSKSSQTLFVTTPFMYAGSLAHHSLLLDPDKIDSLEDFKDTEGWKGLFSSSNYRWAKTLITPLIVFIDEVDSYPISTLLCLAGIIRLLLKRNPDTYVILSSGTLGNPDRLAQLFFGPSKKYVTVPGTGRHGTTSISVYHEENPMELLQKAIQGLKNQINKEFDNIHPNTIPSSYTPDKDLFYINDKFEIAVRENIGDFDQFFTTLHGDMNPDLLMEKIREFESRITKFSLVTTDIAQSGFDPSNVNWMLWYGTPENNRVFLQRYGRVARNSTHRGHIDIILRASVPYERWLADPANRTQLKEYITQQNPPPCQVPLYTPKTLQYTIILGLIFGEWDVMEFLKDWTGNRNDEVFQKDLQLAYQVLLASNAITLGEGGKIRPTKKTRDWLFNFPRKYLSSDIYTVYQVGD
jgi:hypothetical protein